MAPKRGSKRKTSTKSKPKSAPKTRKRPSQTNALLKQVLVALGGRSGPEPRIVSRGRGTAHGFPGGPSYRPYTQPQEIFEGVKYNGRDFARINCPSGKLADYETGTCKDANIYLGKCKKGDYADPFSGQCVSYMEPKLGYRYENGELRHIGVPYDRDNAWSYMKKLPTTFPVGDKGWYKGPRLYAGPTTSGPLGAYGVFDS